MEVIPFVTLKHTLSQHSIFHSVVTELVGKIKLILPEIDALKLDIELTKLVCNAVKNLLSRKQEKQFDIKSISLAVINKLFELSNEEVDIVSSQIEFLFNNNQIKRVPILKKIRKELLAWLQRKFM